MSAIRPQESNRPIPLVVILLLLQATTLAASLHYLTLKEKTLDFRPDYSFYLQMYHRLFDQGLPEQLDFVVKGDNFLGFSGWDSGNTLDKSIHFEPIKYAEAYLLHHTGDLRSIFIWRAVANLIPLIYLTLSVCRAPNRLVSVNSALIACLIYTLYPTMFELVGYDLRPFALMVPVFTTMLISTLYCSKTWQLAAMIHLGMLIREEMIVLSAIAIGLFFARNYNHPSVFGKVRRLMAHWFVWPPVLYLYYSWTGFSNSRSLTMWMLLIIIILIVLAVSYLALLVIAPSSVGTYLEALTILAIPGPTILVCLQSLRHSDSGISELLLHPRTSLLAPFVVVAYLYSQVPRRTAKRTAKRLSLIGRAASALLLVISALYFFFAAGGYCQKTLDLSNLVQETEYVHRLSDTIDLYSGTVLCDYWTCQAFAGHGHAIHFGSIGGSRGFRPLSEIQVDQLAPENIVLRTDLLSDSRTKMLLREKIDMKCYRLRHRGIYLIFKQDCALLPGNRSGATLSVSP